MRAEKAHTTVVRTREVIARNIKNPNLTISVANTPPNDALSKELFVSSQTLYLYVAGPIGVRDKVLKKWSDIYGSPTVKDDRAVVWKVDVESTCEKSSTHQRP